MGEHGSLGEAYAARMLEEKGYQILARNFHTRFGELDIVAQKGEILAFVEVKTRATGSLARPAAAVSPGKQRRVILAAEGYLLCCPTGLQPRFDVIEVVTEGGADFRVRDACHLENAFELTGANHS